MKHPQPRRHRLFPLLILSLVMTAALSPAMVIASSLSDTLTANLPDTTLDEVKASTSPPDTALTPNAPLRKQILNDDAKDMSGFFIIGIAVNIIMALSFAWWFTREWRRPRK